MRHPGVATFALLALLAVAAPAAAAPEGQMTWGVHISLAPTWFDPAETQGIITPFMVMYALHDALAKAMPGNATAPSLAESWQVSPDGRVYDFTLRKGVKFHNGDTADLRGREVLVRALQGRRRQGHQGPRRRRGDAGAAAGAVPAEEPVARLHDVLHGGQRRGLDRAEEVRREGRRRRVQEGADRRRALQVRLVHARRRAGHGGLRRLLAQDAEREAARLQGHRRRVDPAGRPEARRGRRRVLDPRRARGGAAAHARAHAEAGGDPGPAVGQHARPVGPEVALARPAGAAGRQPRDRPQGHQPGDHARPLAADVQHHPEHVRLLLAAAGLRASIPRRPRSSSPRRATRTASTRATTTSTSRTRTCRRRSRATCSRSASAPS